MLGREEGREINDEILIKQVLEGNDHAFRLIIENYRNYVYHTVYSVLRNEKDAEDATQEVFIKVYSSLPKYKGKGFTTWITRIAVNHAIDIKRKKQRRREEIIEDVGEQYKQADHRKVEDGLFQKEKEMLVHKRIQELPQNYRDVVYGYYIEEKTFQQLAAEQQLKEKSIRVKLHRARKWMREHWKEEDFL